MKSNSNRTEIIVDLDGTIKIIIFINGKAAMVTDFDFGDCVSIETINELSAKSVFRRSSVTDRAESEPEVLSNVSSDVIEKTNQVGDEPVKPQETSLTNREKAGLEECIERDRRILLILGFLIKPNQLLLAGPKPILLLSAGSVDVEEIQPEKTMIGNEQVVSDPDSRLTNSEVMMLTFIMDKDGTSRDIVEGLNLKATVIRKSVKMLKDSNLIYIGSDELLRANFEKVLSLYPWLGSKMIQDIILQKLESGDHLNFAPSVQRILCLLSSHPEGLHSREFLKILGLVSAGFVYPKKILTELDIIEVTIIGGQRDGYRILPKFEINQVRSNDPVLERKSIESTITEIQKTPLEPIIPALKEALDEVKAPVDTPEGFNIKDLTSVVNRIKHFSEIQVPHISSKFSTGKDKLFVLLDVINKIVKIEVAFEGKTVMTSWKSDTFMKIDLDGLVIRKKSILTDEQVAEAELPVVPVEVSFSIDERDEEQLAEGKRLREIDRIKKGMNSLDLSMPYRIVMEILLEAEEFQVERKALISAAIEEGLRYAQIKANFEGLANLKYVLKRSGTTPTAMYLNVEVITKNVKY